MSQFLPTHGFEWVDDVSSDNCLQYNESTVDWKTKILSLSDEQEDGYIFEVDLEYPQELHDLHDTYPVAPEHMEIEKSMLSPYQQKLGEKLKVKGKARKLCTTLYNKNKYITHYRNLKKYIELGLIITKVHRILRFKQSAWLKPYIDLNTKLRQQSTSKFEESFAKLMNNAFFGKTCEDVRKYKNVKICRTTEKARKYLSKTSVRSWKMFDEDLLGLSMVRDNVLLNKPRYIGFTVLELSKLVMYDFHYEYMMKEFPKTKLLFTDTDSFCYFIETEKDIYENFQKSDWFDFSNYPDGHPMRSTKYKLLPGKFKDEMGGKAIEEFVGLRSKMYSIQSSDGKQKNTAKGVSQSVTLNHEDYYNCLFNQVCILINVFIYI